MSTNLSENSIERSLRLITLFLGLIFLALVLTFCFVASSLCITIVMSVFLAILVEPLVGRLEKLHLGRPLAAGAIVVCGTLLVEFLGYGVYRKANSFADQLPTYSDRIRQALNPMIKKLERFQKNAESITPVDGSQRIPEVKIKESPNWPSFLARGVGSISNILVIAGVVPFLSFFMLVKKDQMCARFSCVFENKINVPKFISGLDRMRHGFVVGNLVVGSVMAGGTSLVFLILGMKNAVTLGLVTAVLNLIPFFGVILASVAALAAALVQFDTVGPFIVILLAIPFLHFVAVNMLIPRLVGSRVSVGPVAITVGMLFWGWLWGAIGLLLAVPLTALVRLIADSQPAVAHLSNILAETPRPSQRSAQFRESTFDRVERPYFAD